MVEKGERVSERNKTRITAKRLQNKPQQAREPLKEVAIGQDWRVGADTLNIILYRHQVNKKTGNEYWRRHSYYDTIANALVGLADQEIRDTELADLKMVCNKIDQLHKDILKVCEELKTNSTPAEGKSSPNPTPVLPLGSRLKGKGVGSKDEEETVSPKIEKLENERF